MAEDMTMRIATALKRRPDAVSFEAAVLRNAYCPECRLCCGPQPEDSEPFPMPLLDRQISGRTPDDFYLADEHTPVIDRRGCKSAGPTGCRLDRAMRPVACNIYPLVTANGGLFLDMYCPVTRMLSGLEWHKIARSAAEWLNGLSKEDVFRLNIELSEEEISEGYRDLGFAITGGKS